MHPLLKLLENLVKTLILDVGVSDPGGPQPTSEFYAACPCPDGLMQDETQEGV